MILSSVLFVDEGSPSVGDSSAGQFGCGGSDTQTRRTTQGQSHRQSKCEHTLVCLYLSIQEHASSQQKPLNV